MTDIIMRTLIQNLSHKDQMNIVGRGLKIACIHAHRDINFKTKELKVKKFTLWFQIERTGFLSPSTIIDVQWNSEHRKLFNLLLEKIENNSEEFYSQDYFAHQSKHLSTLFIPKNLGMKIQNKMKLSYRLTRKQLGEEKDNTFKEFFEITLKNFSNFPMYIPTNQSLEFFNYFPNKEIKGTALDFEVEAERSIGVLERSRKAVNKEVESQIQRLHEYENDIAILKDIQEKKENVNEKIYQLFSPEEIASIRLLREVK